MLRRYFVFMLEIQLERYLYGGVIKQSSKDVRLLNTTAKSKPKRKKNVIKETHLIITKNKI